MDRKFLLTYSYENDEGMNDSDFNWYKTEEDMREDINSMKGYLHDFEVCGALEVISSRTIEV